MSTPPATPPTIDPTVAPLGIHSDFIKEQLPSWITQAEPSLLRALRLSILKNNQSRHDLKDLMDVLQSPAAFAKPLLKEAIQKELPHLQDIENIIFEREWKNSHLAGLIKNHAATTQQSLLEAALQNFDDSEVQPGGMDEGTCLYTPIKKGKKQSTVTALQFANLCRHLDVGEQYQTHINAVFNPPAAPSLTRTATQVHQLFSVHDQHTFEVALHIAYLQNQIEKPLYDDLLIILSEGQHPSLKCSHLEINSIKITGALVIGSANPNEDQVLYIPEDPLQVFRKHTSMTDLEYKLAERLKNSEYEHFFRSLFPLSSTGTLYTVREPYWAESGEGPSILITPFGIQEPVYRIPIEGNFFEGIAQQRITQIKENAAVLAVPTAQADKVGRQKRRQHYIDMGKSVLFFALSLIPVVGMALLVVSAPQIVSTVYNGFAAWRRHDSTRALEELLNVVDSVALAAVTVGAFKTASFTTSLIKVRLANGGFRLWNPDLVPYRHLKPYPAGLRANAEGLYQHEQNQYLELDDHSHRVELDQQTQQWRLQHPSDPDAYTPLMLSNRAGGWRAEHETPYDWSDLKLIRRLGPDAQNITQAMVEPVLQLSGTDINTLRETHQDSVPPPAALLDTSRRFSLKQEIDDFTFARALGASVSAYSPLIQRYLIESLAQWPKNRALRITQRQGNTSNTNTNTSEDSPDIEVPESRLIKGELLNVLEEEMELSEFEALLPDDATAALNNVQRLARRLHAEATQQKALLSMWLNDYVDNPSTALEYDIRKIVPLLSKSYLREITAVLNKEEGQRLALEKSLTYQQHWEADQYVKETHASVLFSK